jgi:hypothetical protein
MAMIRWRREFIRATPAGWRARTGSAQHDPFNYTLNMTVED